MARSLRVRGCRKLDKDQLQGLKPTNEPHEMVRSLGVVSCDFADRFSLWRTAQLQHSTLAVARVTFLAGIRK
jgi:hypothetical protein